MIFFSLQIFVAFIEDMRCRIRRPSQTHQPVIQVLGATSHAAGAIQASLPLHGHLDYDNVMFNGRISRPSGETRSRPCLNPIR